MSQHCKANPCCGEVPCKGIPLPQHISGLSSHNTVFADLANDVREEMKISHEAVRISRNRSLEGRS